MWFILKIILPIKLYLVNFQFKMCPSFSWYSPFIYSHSESYSCQFSFQFQFYLFIHSTSISYVYLSFSKSIYIYTFLKWLNSSHSSTPRSMQSTHSLLPTNSMQKVGHSCDASPLHTRASTLPVRETSQFGSRTNPTPIPSRTHAMHTCSLNKIFKPNILSDFYTTS